jgi:vacuolar-type H+-ATPase subunit I/STV1
MDEDIVIIIASAVTGLAAMGTLLVGLHMWLKARAHRLGGAVRDELDDLRAAVAQLRREVEHTCGELSAGQQELHERIDFAERLLSRGNGPPM